MYLLLIPHHRVFSIRWQENQTTYCTLSGVDGCWTSGRSESDNRESKTRINLESEKRSQHHPRITPVVHFYNHNVNCSTIYNPNYTQAGAQVQREGQLDRS